MNSARLLPFNTPLTLGRKSGNKDPRGFVSGNDPSDNWDIWQFSRARASFPQVQPVQYSQAHSEIAGADTTVRTIPTRVSFIPYQATQTVANTPTFVVPRNPKRVSLFIGNRHATLPLNYSFGPVRVTSAGGPLGLLLALNSWINLTGETCPTDEIWLWVTGAGNNDFLVYEGIESLGANL